MPSTKLLPLFLVCAVSEVSQREADQDRIIQQLLKNQEKMMKEEQLLENRIAEIQHEHSASVLEKATKLSTPQRRLEETDHIGNNISLLNGTLLDLDVGGSKANLKAALDGANTVLTDFKGKIDGYAVCLDYMWLLVSGALVMFMQAGFAILESGSVRAKNGGMVLMKNVLDACVGTLAWYFIGYGLAYGVPDDAGDFIGTQQFFGGDFAVFDDDDALVGSGHFKDWFFQWAFCATAATIVSGGVAERVRLPAYVLYSIIMTGFIYPVVVYWTWSGSGWLTIDGYSDFAGSGIVHLTGGIAAFVGALIVGPRSGRFDEPEKFDPHNMGMVVLGTFILWFGWYGFNCGSTLAFSDAATATLAGLVAMNTTISAATGGITVWALRLRQKKYDLAGICNGILAGLVCVCAGVGDMKPELALLTGFLGGIAYELGHVLVLALKIDDPLDAFAVHGCGGMMGTITRPLFSMNGVNGEMMGAHVAGLFAIMAWSGGITLIVFLPLRIMGQLRVDNAEESEGGDKQLSPSKMYTESSA